MKMKHLSKIFLMAAAWIAGATQVQASDWSITFDGKVSTDKTAVTISESVATIGGVTMGTVSWGGSEAVEIPLLTTPTSSEFTIDPDKFDGTNASTKLVLECSDFNQYYWRLGAVLNNQWPTDPEYASPAGLGGWLDNSNTTVGEDGIIEFTFGENTAGLFSQYGLKVSLNNVTVKSAKLVMAGGHTLDPKFVLQTGTSWLLRTGGNNGLYSNNSGARSFGLLNCKAGQVITINASLDPNPATNATLKSQDGDNYKYVVTADGDVRFQPARYILLHSITIDPGYSVTFKIGDDVQKVVWYEAGETVAAEENPTQEGYTFSGWSGYPENMVMPNYNITVSGSYNVNYHNIMYKVDGNDYQGYYYIAYGTTLSPDYVPANPTKEGHSFTGWENLPETMPDYDLVVNALFSEVATYTISYVVDGVVVATESLQEGQTPTPPATATKTGYTFTGWTGVPATMPAQDVTATAQFTINSYTLTYMVDGQVYGTPETLEYGATITPKAEPTREGYSFSGWQNLPLTMPAQNVVVTGVFGKDKTYTTIRVGATGYSTFCSTSALSFVGNEAVKAYIAVSKNATAVTLQQIVGNVAAGTGLLLKGSANAATSIEMVENGTQYENNLLVGVTSGTTTINAANKYVLVVKDGVVKFADTYGRQAEVPAGKAYLQVENANARELTFFFEGESTAIETIAKQDETDGVVYNLRGQRVDNPGKGLYIVNGKKVIIK